MRLQPQRWSIDAVAARENRVRAAAESVRMGAGRPGAMAGLAYITGYFARARRPEAAAAASSVVYIAGSRWQVSGQAEGEAGRASCARAGGAPGRAGGDGRAARRLPASPPDQGGVADDPAGFPSRSWRPRGGPPPPRVGGG